MKYLQKIKPTTYNFFSYISYIFLEKYFLVLLIIGKFDMQKGIWGITSGWTNNGSVRYLIEKIKKYRIKII